MSTFFKKGSIFIGIISIVFSAAFIFTSTIRAQSATPNPLVQQTEKYVCLRAVVCGGPQLSERTGGPSPTPSDAKCKMSDDSQAHTVLLKAKNTITDEKNRDGSPKEAYVLEVIMTVNGPIATTGSIKGDTAIKLCSSDKCTPGTTNYEILNSDAIIRYEFVKLTGSDQTTQISNPIILPSGGILPDMYWTSNRGGMEREGRMGSSASYFYLYYKVDEETSNSTAGSHMQGTFSLTLAESNCDIVRYDPWGYVFDKDTLERISDVQVSVLKKDPQTGQERLVNNQDIFPATIVNPQTSAEDGGYSILLPPETYRMTINRGSINSTSVHPNYRLVLPEGTQLYDGKDFVETKELRLDIPVENNPPYRAPEIKMLTHTEFIDVSTSPNQQVYKIQFSQPLTRLNLYAEKIESTTPQRRFLFSANADKHGWVEARVSVECRGQDIRCLQPGEQVSLEQERIDATALPAQVSLLEQVTQFIASLFRVSQVEAQTTSQKKELAIEPILNYVQGCAYSGSIKLPFATVGVYPSFSQTPFYTTQADAEGCFTITSENLPKFPYKLKYTTGTGQVVNVTTSTFVEQNKNYIASNNINVNTYKDSQGNTVPQTVEAQEKAAGRNGGSNDPLNSGTNGTGTQGMNTANSSFMLMVVVLLLLLGTVGLVLAFYIYKKNKATV